MSKFKTRIRAKAVRGYIQIQDWIEHLRGNNRFIRADFDHGGKTLHTYLTTHRNRYFRHVGAHFLLQLYGAGPEVFQWFAEKHKQYGWHFELTHEEAEALKRARDITCTHTRISNLRYTTNVFEQIFNSRQVTRMLGLGAVAGSAGILLGLGELFFFFKETAKKIVKNVVGFDLDFSEADNTRFVELAKEITAGAVNPDGSLDAIAVADRIENLVETLEKAGDVDAAVNALNGNTTYLIGILTRIAFLIVGRGLVQLVLEGLNGAMSKIDALVTDMDHYANWKLGRSPYPPSARVLPGDLIFPDKSSLLKPHSLPALFPGHQSRL